MATAGGGLAAAASAEGAWDELLRCPLTVHAVLALLAAHLAQRLAGLAFAVVLGAFTLL